MNLIRGSKPVRAEKGSDQLVQFPFRISQSIDQKRPLKQIRPGRRAILFNMHVLLHMQKIISSLICLCLVAMARAQEVASLMLSIVNAQQQPVQFATVALHRLPDSALVKVQMTDAEGKVTFVRLKKENYFCRVSHTGFAPYTTSVIAITKGQTVFPPVVLQPAGAEMTGVTITARKPFVEMKPGKTVVNLDAGITYAGTTAMEALEKMPGITVDQDGNISLKGKAGVLVMIDGKPTYLDAAQLATMLNGMSAAQIEQVEIMDQPSAAFDAAGNAGIINIKLKKSRQRGLNGSFTTSYAQGFYPKNNNSFQINYRNGKWNFFGSYSVNVSGNFTRVYALRTYFEPDGTVAAIMEQPGFFKGSGNTHNLRTGADVSLSDKTSLGFTLTGLSLGRNSRIANEALWLSPQKLPDSLLRTTGSNNTNWKNAGASANFRHRFTASRELTADVDLIGYRTRGEQLFQHNLIFPGSYEEASRAFIPSDLKIVSAKADYLQQFKKMRVETGVKASRITTDNLAAYEIKEGAGWTPDWGKTNHFLYTENIRAVYTSVETKTAKWTVQAGLRFEATDYNANQLGNRMQKDSSFSRSYNNLFPTLLTSFAADSNHSFSISAGRRIDRPPFQKLNPFIFIINKYTYQQGNPYFRPQYTWNLEASHAYKNKFITTAGYSLTTDYFSQIFPVDSNGLVIYTEGNLGKLQQFNLSVSVQLTPYPWWSFSSQVVGVHKKMEGVIGRQLRATITQFTLNLNNQFRLKKGWSGEISGFYASRSQSDIQEIVDPSGQLSLGLAKTVWQNKGTIKLAVRDLFYTQWIKGDTFFPSATEYFKLTRDSRVIQLSFSYRFGKTFKGSKRSEGSAGDELRRVGNG